MVSLCRCFFGPTAQGQGKQVGISAAGWRVAAGRNCDFWHCPALHLSHQQAPAWASMWGCWVPLAARCAGDPAEGTEALALLAWHNQGRGSPWPCMELRSPTAPSLSCLAGVPSLWQSECHFQCCPYKRADECFWTEGQSWAQLGVSQVLGQLRISTAPTVAFGFTKRGAGFFFLAVEGVSTFPELCKSCRDVAKIWLLGMGSVTQGGSRWLC